MSNVSSHFAGLDLIRFFAAALVVIYHLGFWSWAPANGVPDKISGAVGVSPELASFAWAGWVGVEIFFVLSGFVIVFSANDSAWNFARSRMLRLIPATWICAPLAAMAYLPTDLYSAGDLPIRLFKTFAFWPYGPWVDGVYWTLGIEVSFYALIFALIATRSLKHLNLTLAVIGIGSSLYWITHLAGQLLHPTVGLSERALRLGMSARNLELVLLAHGCFFAVGGLLWSLLSNKGPRQLWLVVILCVLSGTIEIYSAARPSMTIAGAATAALPISIWLISVGLIIASVVFAGPISSVIPANFSRAVGLATYPLYLIHDAIGARVLAFARDTHVAPWIAICCAVSIVVGLSFAISIGLEPIVRSKLAALLDGAGSARGFRIAAQKI